MSESATSKTEMKAQVIQDEMSRMPKGAIVLLVADLESTPPSEVIDDWYRRALSAQASRKYPDAEPLDSVEDWHKLSDRILSSPRNGISDA